MNKLNFPLLRQSMAVRFAVACALNLAVVWGCRAQMGAQAPLLAPMVEPKNDGIWTSTREIRALRFINGDLWAATAGGVLRFHEGKLTKATRSDGLPSHEALEITKSGEFPTVRFPTATALFDGANWNVTGASAYKVAPRVVTWSRREIGVELDGLRMGGKFYPLPKESMGTHISAAYDAGMYLLVAIYGDGLWKFQGKWSRAEVGTGLPSKAREITALARDAKSGLWVGTRREGLFCRNVVGKDGWQQILQGDEPLAHNVQNFAEFGGVLWASTLDDGLVCRTGNTWKSVSMPTLSSSAPRQMVEWQSQLYVRHGSGIVDSFDGHNWTKDALKTIPRKGVYALANNASILFAAGWGGWSQWDGKTWTPHFDLPALKGVPLMGLLVQGDELWIATQSRGLGRYNRKTGEFRWFDERDGLPDDWVTTLTTFDGKLHAGTFVGGLARLDGDKWVPFESMKGENVTALTEFDGKLWAATRTGVWRVEGDGAVKIEKPWLDSECQALYAGKGGIWVGARTSIDFLAWNGGDGQVG